MFASVVVVVLLLVAQAGAELSVSVPAYDQWVGYGTDPEIQWSGDGLGYVRIELWRGDDWQQGIIGSTRNDGAYNKNIKSWSAVQKDGNQFRIKIIELQAPNSFAFSPYFCIAKDKETCTPTDLTVTFPACRSTIKQGTTNELTWVVASKPGDPQADNVKLELYHVDSGWFSSITGMFKKGNKHGKLVNTLAASTPNDGSLLGATFASDMEIRDDYYIVVTELDGSKLHVTQSENFCVKNPVDSSECMAACSGEEVNTAMGGGFVFLIVVVMLLLVGGLVAVLWICIKRRRQSKGTQLPQHQDQKSTEMTGAGADQKER